MRNIVILGLVVLVIGGSFLNAEAKTPPPVIPKVYDAQNNKEVTSDSASLTGTVRKDGISANIGTEIMVSANLPCTLAVSLTSSKIDWKINSTGEYFAKAIDISLKTNIKSDVTMNVTGADNLKNSDGKIIETSYSLVGPLDTPMPGVSPYIPADTFNASHSIKVSNEGIGQACLWNKVKAVSGTAAGTYTDTFTVTFSQTL